jgi:hypothetical protein
MSRAGRIRYTAEDDDKIIHYVITHPTLKYTSDEVWDTIAREQITNHSAGSMKDRYLKRLKKRVTTQTRSSQNDSDETAQQQTSQEANSEVDDDEPDSGTHYLSRQSFASYCQRIYHPW